MKKIEKLPKDALVVACDSHRALFLRNAGTTMKPELVTEHHMDAPPNPANRDQQSDRPGRMSDQKIGGGKGPVSAMEQSDWQKRNEEQFAADVAAKLEAMHRKTPLETIVLAAPPTFLGTMRKVLAEPVKRVVRAEFAKDLTKMPVPEIANAIIDL